VTDHTLARLACLSAAVDGGWVCRTRLEHLDWRPLVEAGLAERTPALGHVRLTPLGWARAQAWAAARHRRAAEIDPRFGGAQRRAAG
jgi:hypothetical protein